MGYHGHEYFETMVMVVSKVKVKHFTGHKHKKRNAVVWYRRVAFQQLVSVDGLVQTRLAHVDVAVLGEGREQGEEGLRVHVVIIIHMAKPPEEPQNEERDTVVNVTLGFLASSC